jgi:hypothetical protein
MSRAQLEGALERNERERKALEQNIHELMENLRAAAAEAGRASEKQS